MKELKKLFIDVYNDKFRHNHGGIELKDVLYHYLKIFSMIITYLNTHVFYDLIEWLKFIIIDQ